jgi:hypothetical protein
MKYNPKVNERAVAMPGLCHLHPLQPEADLQGILELLYHTRVFLEEIAGPVEALLQKPEEEALAQIKRACCVSSDLTLYGLAEALHGDLQGDFSRLSASLDKAQVLYERRVS